MIDIRFEIDGQKVSRRLDIAASAFENMYEPLDDIGSAFLKTFDLNFSQRGALYGGWAPRKKSYPHPLLEKTGTMRGSFDKGVTNTKVELFNTADYFKYHQSKAPRGALPRRVMMAIRRQDARMITKTFQSYAQKALQGRTSGAFSSRRQLGRFF